MMLRTMSILCKFYIGILLILGPHFVNCVVDWRVSGEAVITEAKFTRVGTQENSHTKKPFKTVKVGTKQAVNATGELEAIKNEETTPGGDNWSSGSNEALKGDVGTGPSLSSHPELNSILSYPWMVAIKKDKKQICTGTLVDKEYVLTTAWCLFNLTGEDLGELELDIGFQAKSMSKYTQHELSEDPFMTRNVKRSIRHLRFNPLTAFNDIALLQLITPITTNEEVRPLLLVNPGSIEPDDQNQRIIGWRAGMDLNGENVQYWRDQISPGSTLDKCRVGYSDILDDTGISPDMICSGGYTDGTSCRWLFGTPLLVGSKLKTELVASKLKTEDVEKTKAVELRQIGMFSWGSEALLPNCRFSEERPTPMVFTRISSYFDWVQRFLQHT